MQRTPPQSTWGQIFDLTMRFLPFLFVVVLVASESIKVAFLTCIGIVALIYAGRFAFVQMNK